MQTTTHNSICSFCEASCGLLVDVADGRVRRVRPNHEDVLSRGHICAKGVALLALSEDPDRLRTPVRRDKLGQFHPISWDEAFTFVAARLREVQRRHGRDAVAVYAGNPFVHKHSTLLLRTALLGALRTRNATSAGSQDTSPRMAASNLLYGNLFSMPVPDLDRTHYMLCIGANPLVSNGSLMAAPKVSARLGAILARGGKLVVVDPRRTETAKLASEHIPIRPGSDAAFLLAMTHSLWSAGRIDEALLERTTRGWPEVRRQLAAFSPERVERFTAVPAATTRRLALEFIDAQSSVAYVRVGVCNNAFATLANYAADLLNIVAGRLGATGGAMFPTPAIDLATLARWTGNEGFGRWASRVRKLPETGGDLPASILAEEMETPGAGQVRAFVTISGNPVLSTPNGRRLRAAVAKLDFMVSIDMYINETTRLADIILPPALCAAEDYVDLFFAHTAVHNGIRWSEPVVARGADERTDAEIMLELAYRLGGGPTGIRGLDWLARVARRLLGWRFRFDPLIALLLRIGPYGDHFLPWRRGLTLAKLKAAPNGIDLGPLQPGSARRIFHSGARIQLASKPILSAMAGLLPMLEREPRERELLLVGRRHSHSNNTWMHNLLPLAAERRRCTLLVHPADAEAAGVRDGAVAALTSRTHRGRVQVELSEDVARGVVSLPHGWGHEEMLPFQRVAGATPGVSANDWTDDQSVEGICGQSILNGVPVQLAPLTNEASVSAGE